MHNIKASISKGIFPLQRIRRRIGWNLSVKVWLLFPNWHSDSSFFSQCRTLAFTDFFRVGDIFFCSIDLATSIGREVLGHTIAKCVGTGRSRPGLHIGMWRQKFRAANLTDGRVCADRKPVKASLWIFASCFLPRKVQLLNLHAQII